MMYHTALLASPVFHNFLVIFQGEFLEVIFSVSLGRYVVVATIRHCVTLLTVRKHNICNIHVPVIPTGPGKMNLIFVAI